MKGTMDKLVVLLCLLGSLSVVTSSLITYTITEEISPGSLVANILQDSGVQSRYTAEVLSVLRFTVIQDEEEEESASSLFRIDDNADVRTDKRVDREGLCAYKQSCIVKLDIQVQPIEYFQILKVEIEILDLNDQAPSFPEDSIVLSLSEAAATGSALTLPLADDKDSPKFGVQEYTLVGTTSTFELNVKTNTDGSKVPQLVLMQAVDRESITSYSLQVMAKDGGSPAKTGMLSIIIEVIDVNDNPTVFEQESYEISIAEDIPINAPILRVKASDADTSGSTSLVYQLSAKSKADFGHLFTINNATGDIYLTGSLDFESESEYVLDVKAQDKSPGAIATVTKVTINILDINDNAPKIKLNSLTSTGHAQISEFATRGSFVAHVTVVDQDSGENGQFHCSLNSDLFELEQLYPTEFKLVTKATFDREVKADYSVTLTCSDLGASPMTSSKIIPVTILDENDNFPVFNQVSYKATILENSKFGTSIVQVQADDLDFGDNSLISYDLTEQSIYFNIDHDSGVIISLRELDYEEIKSHTIYAVATDSGNPPKSSTCLIVIDVVDTDDQQPTFVQTHYTFVVPENEPLQTEIGQVIAEDKDSEDFNDFHFELKADTSSPVPSFAINKITGMIYSEATFDREERSMYSLTVLAVSEGIKPTTSSTLVTVYIADANDHRPQVQFPNGNNDTVYIPSHLPQGEAVTQIQAFDLDTGSNAHLTYSIESGKGKDLFVMDTSSGFIFVGGAFDRDVESEVYKLNIRVKDGGAPPRAVNTILNIVVNRSDLYNGPQDGLAANDNLTIVIVIACMSGLLVVVLVIAIVAIIRQQRRKNMNKHQDMNRVLNHTITIEPSKTDTVNEMAVNVDNLNNDNLANMENRLFPKKKKRNGRNMGSDDVERDEKRKKGVSFAVNEGCDVNEAAFKPLTIQTGSMELPVEDKDSGCSMDTSNADSGQGSTGSDDAFDHLHGNRLNNGGHPHLNTHQHRLPNNQHRRQTSQDATTHPAVIRTQNLPAGRHSNHGNDPSKPALPPRENRNKKNISQTFARDVLYRDLKKESPVNNVNNHVCKVHGLPNKYESQSKAQNNSYNEHNSVNLHEISSEVHV